MRSVIALGSVAATAGECDQPLDRGSMGCGPILFGVGDKDLPGMLADDEDRTRHETPSSCFLVLLARVRARFGGATELRATSSTGTRIVSI